MKHFVRKHKKKIIVGHGIATVLFLLSTTLLLSEDDAVVFFTPLGSEVLPVRQTIDVDVQVSSKVPLNAVGATMTYPKDMVEVVGVSKKRSFFDLWTEDTIIRDDAGEVVFSGGTLRQGGLIGNGTVLTVTLRALKAGNATLELKNTQVLASDGHGSAIEHAARTLSLIIPEVVISAPAQSSESTGTVEPTPQKTVEGDFDGDGRVSMSDASALLVRMLWPYERKYDLDGNGSVGISDLSVLLSKF